MNQCSLQVNSILNGLSYHLIQVLSPTHRDPFFYLCFVLILLLHLPRILNFTCTHSIMLHCSTFILHNSEALRARREDLLRNVDHGCPFTAPALSTNKLFALSVVVDHIIPIHVVLLVPNYLVHTVTQAKAVWL